MTQTYYHETAYRSDAIPSLPPQSDRSLGGKSWRAFGVRMPWSAQYSDTNHLHTMSFWMEAETTEQEWGQNDLTHQRMKITTHSRLAGFIIFWLGLFIYGGGYLVLSDY
ncbi:MAG: hypothetical protein V7629_18655 [Motiliproteus sp.]